MKAMGIRPTCLYPSYGTQYSWWQACKELGLPGYDPQVPPTAWDRYSKRNLADREYTETTFGLCRVIT